MVAKVSFAILVVAALAVMAVHAAEVDASRKHHRRALTSVGATTAVRRYTTTQLLDNKAVKQYFEERPVVENTDAPNTTYKGVEITVISLKFPNGTKNWVHKQSYQGTDLSIKFDKPYVDVGFEGAYKTVNEQLNNQKQSTVAAYDSTSKLYKFQSKGTLLTMRADTNTERTVKTSNKLKLLWPKTNMPESARIKFGLNNDASFRIGSQNVDTPTDEGVFSVWSGASMKVADLIGDNKTIDLKMHIMQNIPPYVELTYSAKYIS